MRGDSNIDVNAKDAKGNTALDIAVHLRRPDLVSSLLRYPTLKCGPYDKHFHEIFNDAVKNALDDAGKNKNIENYDSIQKNNLEIIKQLIDKGGICSGFSFIPAVLKNNNEVVRLLANGTRKPGHIDHIIRASDIFVAAWKQGVSKEILDDLVEHGANVNYYSPGASTYGDQGIYSKNRHTHVSNLLHEALEKKEVEKAIQLLIYGADTSLPNKEGIIPENLIHNLNNEELNKVYETQKAEVEESGELMKKINESKAVPPNTNDELLNKLMFFLEHSTLTHSIKKAYNLSPGSSGLAKANEIRTKVQGIITKYQNAKKRAAHLAGNLLQPGPSGASSSPPRTPSPERKGSFSRAL